MGLQVNTGMDARYSEYWLRSCFQEHAQQLRGGRVAPAAELQAGDLPGDALVIDGAPIPRRQLRRAERVLELRRREDQRDQIV